MLFLNISSDKVQIHDGSKELFLERNGIEKTLGPVMVNYYKSLASTSSASGQSSASMSGNMILVLNGPGGFTNLRVGTLVINLLKTLNPEIQLFSMTKFDLYRHLYQKGFLPRYGLLYLGQKKNVWEVDWEEVNPTLITPNPSLIKRGINNSLFLDYVHDEKYREELWYDYENMLSFWCDGNALLVKYKKNSISISPSDLGLVPCAQITPEYFISAL